VKKIILDLLKRNKENLKYFLEEEKLPLGMEKMPPPDRAMGYDGSRIQSGDFCFITKSTSTARDAREPI